jgi:quinol monooxygenase YgiN
MCSSPSEVEKFRNFSILGQFTGYSDGTMGFEAVALPEDVTNQIIMMIEAWKDSEQASKS